MATLIENIVKTLTRLEIMNLFEILMFFKLVAQRKASFRASLSSITVFSCAHIKRGFKGFLPLR